MKRITSSAVFTIFLIIITISLAVAQNSSSAVDGNNVVERIRYYITNNYKPDKAFLNDSCINTVVYLKFKIDDKKIDSVDFSGNSPIQVKQALQKAVILTNKLWMLSENQIQQMKDKVFLLPVIIYYQAGCSPMLVTKEMFEKGGSSIPPNPDIYLHNALNNMLKFENGGSYSQLNCILIKPIYFFNYN